MQNETKLEIYYKRDKTLDRALREERSNETATYNNATAAADFYGRESGLKVAEAEFFNENYGLHAILRDDNHLYLHVNIIDPKTGLPGAVDLLGRAKLIIAEPNGKEIVSSLIDRVASTQFDFGALQPRDYVARLSPPKPD